MTCLLFYYLTQPLYNCCVDVICERAPILYIPQIIKDGDLVSYVPITSRTTPLVLVLTLLILGSYLPSNTTGYLSSYNFDAELQVEMNVEYYLHYESLVTLPTLFELWVSRLNNWSTDGVLGQNYPVQTTKILSIQEPAVFDDYYFDENDVYNNSYDFYNVSLSTSQNSFDLTFEYQLTLNSYAWNIPDNYTLADYNTSSNLYQFYTSAQPYAESDDPYVMDLADTIVGDEISIYSMAKAIFLYLAENFNYEILSSAIGAKAALTSLTGDCSEISSAMVALLRAVGIPARKVLGFALIEGNIAESRPKYDIATGDSFSYAFSNNTFPGHAWVQYWIPELGWISVDPTWGNSLYSSGESLALEYFDRWDYVHVTTTIGDFYGLGTGIDPALFLPADSDGIPEFPYVYPVGNAPTYDFDFGVKIVVTNVTSTGEEGDPTSSFDLRTVLVYVGSGSGIILLGAVFISYFMKKSRARSDSYYR